MVRGDHSDHIRWEIRLSHCAYGRTIAIGRRCGKEVSSVTILPKCHGVLKMGFPAVRTQRVKL